MRSPLPGLAVLCLMASQAAAQEVTTTDDESATTLETLVVTPEPEEVVDLYRFRNPLEVEPTVFERRWNEPPSLEQISQSGGVVPLLVGMAAQQVQKGARKIPGWKGPDQPAIARPPPLDPAQAARALRLQKESELQGEPE